jgi:hypothetical protein
MYLSMSKFYYAPLLYIIPLSAHKKYIHSVLAGVHYQKYATHIVVVRTSLSGFDVTTSHAVYIGHDFVVLAVVC